MPSPSLSQSSRPTRNMPVAQASSAVSNALQSNQPSSAPILSPLRASPGMRHLQYGGKASRPSSTYAQVPATPKLPTALSCVSSPDVSTTGANSNFQGSSESVVTSTKASSPPSVARPVYSIEKLKSLSPNSGPADFRFTEIASGKDVFVVTPTRCSKSASGTPSIMPIALERIVSHPVKAEPPDPFFSPKPVTSSIPRDKGKGSYPPPRSDRRDQQVTEQNAQDLLPAAAVVFVANLDFRIPDADLRIGLAKHFSSYGQCYIALHRDERHHPYAFVQYHDEETADAAVVDANGRWVCGRSCRTEKAKVHRTTYVFKVDGSGVDEREVLEVMAPHGPLESIRPCGESEAKSAGFPLGGIFLTFVYLGDFKDFVKTNPLGSHSCLRMKNVQTKSGPSKSIPAAAIVPSALHSVPKDEEPTIIFVGNIHFMSTAQELFSIFAYFGHITHIQVAPVAASCKAALIEYASAASVQPAIAATNGLEWRDMALRVDVQPGLRHHLQNIASFNNALKMGTPPVVPTRFS